MTRILPATMHRPTLSEPCALLAPSLCVLAAVTRAPEPLANRRAPHLEPFDDSSTTIFVDAASSTG
jgi:hypothetical protein